MDEIRKRSYQSCENFSSKQSHVWTVCESVSTREGDPVPGPAVTVSARHIVRRLGEISTVCGGELQPPHGLFNQVPR